jgi:uncharacterized protein (TIGR02466 family)
MNHITLFPTILGVYNVEDFESINKDVLAVEGLTENKFHFRNYNDLWEYKDKFPGLQKLYDEFLKNAAVYANACYGLDYKPEYFTVLEGWATSLKNDSEEFRIHNHRLTDLACVYYANVSDDSGDIEFYDPRGGLGFVSLDSAKPYNVYRYRPKTGQMILFPGWLLHVIRQNKSDVNRISVATNIKLKDEVRYKKEKIIPPQEIK